MQFSNSELQRMDGIQASKNWLSSRTFDLRYLYIKTIFSDQNMTQKQRVQYMKKSKLPRQYGKLKAATWVIGMESRPASIHFSGLSGCEELSCSSFRYTSSPHPTIRKKSMNTIRSANNPQLSRARVSKSTLRFLNSIVVTTAIEAAAMTMRAAEGGLKMKERTSPQTFSRLMRAAPTSILCYFIKSYYMIVYGYYCTYYFESIEGISTYLKIT